MELIKCYCGLRMEFYKGIYYCVDQVTRLVKAKGTRAEMNAYFREHTEEV